MLKIRENEPNFSKMRQNFFNFLKMRQKLPLYFDNVSKSDFKTAKALVQEALCCFDNLPISDEALHFLSKNKIFIKIKVFMKSKMKIGIL